MILFNEVHFSVAEQVSFFDWSTDDVMIKNQFLITSKKVPESVV